MMEEYQIIAAVLSGDVDAYRFLVERYQKPIFNLMYRVTGSREDALDLAQETFIKAYEKLHSFREGAKFFPWLYTIGFNHARNFVRKRKMVRSLRGEDGGERESFDQPWHQEEALCTQLDCHRLDQVLKQIPLDYREALILHYHEGLSMEDIAAGLQISVSGAKMRVHRGIKKLRQILFEEDHEKKRSISAGK
jgi:RNA polymerase sigma-70 factor (ECF subfamily)